MSIIIPYKETVPKIGDDAFTAPNAYIIGDVEIGQGSSIWFGCTLRGDVDNIIIGSGSNIQDHTMIHVSSFGHNTEIGDNVTIGHSCLLHACKIGNGGFVGMQSCIMDGAVIESGAMLAAGSLLPPGKIVPSGQLWAGRPAKYMRDLSDEDIKHMSWSAAHYMKLAEDYI